MQNMLLITFSCFLFLVGCSGTQSNNEGNDENQLSPEMRAAINQLADPTVDFDLLPGEIEAADVSVLFIGNSHTGQFLLSNLVERLMQAGRPEAKLCIKSHFGGGFQLTKHAITQRTLKLIRAGEWDYVVLQGSRNQHTLDGARSLAKIIDAKSKIVMFPVWGYEGNEAVAEQINETHLKLAGEINAQVAPVGMVWWETSKAHPELDLYVEDGNHSTLQGAYLTACTFYSYFYQQSPEDLGMVDLERESEASLDQATRDLIEKCAWEYLTQHNQQANIPSNSSKN